MGVVLYVKNQTYMHNLRQGILWKCKILCCLRQQAGCPEICEQKNSVFMRLYGLRKVNCRQTAGKAAGFGVYRP